MAPVGPISFALAEVEMVDSKTSMAEAVGRARRRSRPVFGVRDGLRIHAVWAFEVSRRLFEDIQTADEGMVRRERLRALYASDRPVMQALGDEGVWPSAVNAQRLLERGHLTFHPAVRVEDTKIHQVNFAVVRMCQSGRHVWQPWSGPTCESGYPWGPEQPL